MYFKNIKDTCTIFYHLTAEDAVGNIQILVLYGIYWNNVLTEEKRNEIATRYCNIHTLEDIQTESIRAYPYYILDDKAIIGIDTEESPNGITLWECIQRDDKANLALSEEQLSMLNQPHFPMFINGQGRKRNNF